jgi:hypothetical protein
MHLNCRPRRAQCDVPIRMCRGRTLPRGREKLCFRRSSVCTVPYALRTAPDKDVGGSDRNRHPKEMYANQASWAQGFSRAQGLQWVHGGCKCQIQCQIRGFEGARRRLVCVGDLCRVGRYRTPSNLKSNRIPPIFDFLPMKHSKANHPTGGACCNGEQNGGLYPSRPRRQRRTHAEWSQQSSRHVLQSSAVRRSSFGSRCSPAGTSWGTFQPK